MAVQYCEKCGVRIDPADFERGNAVRFQNRDYCGKCQSSIAHLLPKSRSQRIQHPSAIVAAVRGSGSAVPTPRASGGSSAMAARDRTPARGASIARRSAAGGGGASAARAEVMATGGTFDKSGVLTLSDEEAQVSLPPAGATRTAYLGAMVAAGVFLAAVVVYMFAERPSYGDISSLTRASEAERLAVSEFTLTKESDEPVTAAPTPAESTPLGNDPISLQIEEYLREADVLAKKPTAEKDLRTHYQRLANYEERTQEKFDQVQKGRVTWIKQKICEMTTELRWTDVASSTRGIHRKPAQERKEEEWISLYEAIGQMLDDYPEERYHSTPSFKTAEEAALKAMHEWWDKFVLPHVQALPPADAGVYIRRNFLDKGVAKHFPGDSYVASAKQQAEEYRVVTTPWKEIVADPAKFVAFEPVGAPHFSNRETVERHLDSSVFKKKGEASRFIEACFAQANSNLWSREEHVLTVTCTRLSSAPAFKELNSFILNQGLALLPADQFGYCLLLTPENEKMNDFTISFEMKIMPGGDDAPEAIYAGKFLETVDEAGERTWDSKRLKDTLAFNVLDMQHQGNIPMKEWNRYIFRTKSDTLSLLIIDGNNVAKPYPATPTVGDAEKRRLCFVLRGWGLVQLRNLKVQNLDLE